MTVFTSKVILHAGSMLARHITLLGQKIYSISQIIACIFHAFRSNLNKNMQKSLIRLTFWLFTHTSIINSLLFYDLFYIMLHILLCVAFTVLQITFFIVKLSTLTCIILLLILPNFPLRRFIHDFFRFDTRRLDFVEMCQVHIRRISVDFLSTVFKKLAQMWSICSFLLQIS